MLCCHVFASRDRTQLWCERGRRPSTTHGVFTNTQHTELHTQFLLSQRKCPTPLPNTKACNADMEVTICRCANLLTTLLFCNYILEQGSISMDWWDYTVSFLIQPYADLWKVCMSGVQRLPHKIRGLIWHPVSARTWSTSKRNPLCHIDILLLSSQKTLQNINAEETLKNTTMKITSKLRNNYAYLNWSCFS